MPTGSSGQTPNRPGMLRRHPYLGILDPSVAQPPLPLQLFLPLQPLSLDLHPPWPLQSFLPLQECLLVSCMLYAPCANTPALLLAVVFPLGVG